MFTRDDVLEAWNAGVGRNINNLHNYVKDNGYTTCVEGYYPEKTPTFFYDTAFKIIWTRWAEYYNSASRRDNSETLKIMRRSLPALNAISKIILEHAKSGKPIDGFTISKLHDWCGYHKSLLDEFCRNNMVFDILANAILLKTDAKIRLESNNVITSKTGPIQFKTAPIDLYIKGPRPEPPKQQDDHIPEPYCFR